MHTPSPINACMHTYTHSRAGGGVGAAAVEAEDDEQECPELEAVPGGGHEDTALHAGRDPAQGADEGQSAVCHQDAEVRTCLWAHTPS